MAIPPVGSLPPDPPFPSWRELSAFIEQQNEAGRALIDRWFTLATWLLGVLIVAISIGLGLFGWRTLADAKATAEEAARGKATEVATTESRKVASDVALRVADKAATEAATAQVKLIMQDTRIQKLVRDTAVQIFREGAYRQTVEQAVHEQMQTALVEGVIGAYDITYNGIPHQSLRIDKKMPAK
jgi:flagellar basal body-associated protein FliL